MLERQFGVAMLVHQLKHMQGVAMRTLGPSRKYLLLKYPVAVLEARVWQGIVSMPFPPFICEDVSEHLMFAFRLAANGRANVPFASTIAINSVMNPFKVMEGAEG